MQTYRNRALDTGCRLWNVSLNGSSRQYRPPINSLLGAPPRSTTRPKMTRPTSVASLTVDQCQSPDEDGVILISRDPQKYKRRIVCDRLVGPMNLHSLYTGRSTYCMRTQTRSPQSCESAVHSISWSRPDKLRGEADSGRGGAGQSAWTHYRTPIALIATQTTRKTAM